MLRDRNIAFFIDVDNVGLSSQQYANVMDQLGAMGSIVAGKIYGAGDRKHKEIYEDADLKGYSTARPMRVKRRGRKEFDARIFVDAVDMVSRVPAIDAVCVIAEPTDLVHFYGYMHSHGVKVIALDNADDASNAFIDEVIDLGVVVELKPAPKAPAKKPAPAPAPKAEPVKATEPAPAAKPTPAEKKELDKTDELLREIERLRALASKPMEDIPATKPTPVEEPAPEEPSDIVEETHALLDKIAEMQEPAEEPAPVEEPAPAPAPRASYSPSNDSDLVRRIEEIRKSNQGADDDLIEEIRKLLDGIE